MKLFVGILLLLLIAPFQQLQAADCVELTKISEGPSIDSLGFDGDESGLILGGHSDQFFSGWTAFVKGAFNIERHAFGSLASYANDAVIDNSGNLYWAYWASYANNNLSTQLERVTRAGTVTTIEFDGGKNVYTYYSSLQIGPFGEFNYFKYRSPSPGIESRFVTGATVAFNTIGDWALRDAQSGWMFGRQFKGNLKTEIGVFTNSVSDTVVGRLSERGTPLWGFQTGRDAAVRSVTLARPNPDGIYVAGTIAPGPSTFGSITTTMPSTNGGSFVLKLSYSGSVLWVRTVPDVHIRCICATPAGGCVIGGQFGDYYGAPGFGAVLMRYNSFGELLADYSNRSGLSDDYITTVVSSGNDVTLLAHLVAPGRLACTNLVAAGTNFVGLKFQLPIEAPTSALISADTNVIEIGGSIYLKAAAVGSPTLSFQWFHDENVIPGATNSILSIVNADSAVEGEYSINVTNSAGSVRSLPFHLTVTHRPLRFVRGLTSQTVAPGDKAVFSAAFESDNPVTIQWFHDEQPISGAVNPTFAIEHVTARDLGRYRVTVFNGLNEISAVATLDLFSPYPESRVLRSRAFVTVPSYVRILDYDFRDPDNLVYEYYLPGITEGNSYGIRQTTAAGSLVWETKSDYYSPNELVYQLTLSRRNDGIIVLGAHELPQLFGTNHPAMMQPAGWVYAQIGPTGAFSNYRVHPFHAGRVNLQQNGNAIINSATNDNQLMVIDSAGNQIARERVQFHGRLLGRSFAADSSETISIREFGATLKPDSLLFGRYSMELKPDWIMQIPKETAQQSATVLAESTVDDALIAKITRDGFNFDIAKVTRGMVAWRAALNATEPVNLRTFAADFGGIIGFGVATNGVQLGTNTLPGLSPSASATFVFVLDAGGRVRSFNRFATSKIPVPEKLTRLGPSYYIAFDKTTKTAIEFEIPEPDITVPPQPEQFTTVDYGSAISLQATPDAAGVADYCWFKDGKEISSATDNELKIDPFTFADAGEYSVRIHNAFGAVTNRVATLNYSGPAALVADAQEGSVHIAWPLSASTYRLVESSDLFGQFTTVTATRSTNSALGVIEVTLPVSTTQRLFRLVNP